ncbi:CgeB family protein [Acaryochloris marina]|uniref:CgeB family protein n=1 Tax=Acaryochloris marina TaxID=155978 RepID=UPI0021C316FB|nr:glycosyltransferase [Acaryochloris marina]BDM80329.1 hypothetical protein AM10699_31970 [Acaryochloris marina MBIC10699]
MSYIWYFGNSTHTSNSYRRYLALLRIGCTVQIFDPFLSVKSWANKFSWKTGYRLVQSATKRWLVSQLEDLPLPDLIWVDSGEFFGVICLKFLKKFNVPIVLYNNDDPTGTRDGNRFRSLIQALPFYDLCVVMREINELEYQSYGARRTLRIWMSYDELVHKNFDLPLDSGKVTFIGTYRTADNRDELLLNLIKADINIEVWGNCWERSSFYHVLSPYCYGEARGNQYSQIIQKSAISLGFLSSTNRDIHTRRSVEIPAAGGLLCAERTNEHQLLFEEGKEAVFWTTKFECIETCKYLLDHPFEREKIRKAGMKKVRQIGVGNQDICHQILTAIL